MALTFCLFIFLLLLSGFRIYKEKTGDRLFPLSLIRMLAGIPLLAGAYVFLTFDPSRLNFYLSFIIELLFAMICLETALFLETDSKNHGKNGRRLILAEFPIAFAPAAICICFPSLAGDVWGHQDIICRDDILPFARNLFILVSMAGMAWHLETFWRNLSFGERWAYKYFVAGCFLICGILGFASAYRLIFQKMNIDHFFFLGVCLILSWLPMAYAAIRHRMFNRKIFVSRKIVYASLAPLVYVVYLIAIWLISLVMKMYDLSFPAILQWLLAVAGIVSIFLMAVSTTVRHHIKYFISTHFYINKYEYRDEWLLFSRLLQGAITETEIVEAMRRVMADSLYAKGIFIWMGDENCGYELVSQTGSSIKEKWECRFSKGHPLISHLKTNTYYYLKSRGRNPIIFPWDRDSEMFPPHLRPVIFTPMIIGEWMVGIVGLAPEFTGGRYGPDDFDLLSAICTQAASAILAARMAEKAALYKQQEAWDVVSAFILHDIKNAAGMLSLLCRNAPDHMHDSEFQTDMLETVRDALKRMEKVRNRMSLLKSEIVPVSRNIDIRRILEDNCRKLERRLEGFSVNFTGPETAFFITDPDLLMRVIENILLNAFEAGKAETLVNIDISAIKRRLDMEISDNGPGIPPGIPPGKLFEPFYTTKSKGTGIGLWQAKRLVTIIGGEIYAGNSDSGGARFVISLRNQPNMPNPSVF